MSVTRISSFRRRISRFGAVSKKLTKAYGYDLIFHQLRHLNASVMLMLGIPDKCAMERGGWSSNGVLKSVYQHTFSEECKLVDERIDGYFDALLNG